LRSSSSHRYLLSALANSSPRTGFQVSTTHTWPVYCLLVGPDCIKLCRMSWMILFQMPIPETTSAEAFERYVGGKCLRACRGEAWRDIKAWIIAPPRVVDM